MGGLTARQVTGRWIQTDSTARARFRALAKTSTTSRLDIRRCTAERLVTGSVSTRPVIRRWLAPQNRITLDLNDTADQERPNSRPRPIKNAQLSTAEVRAVGKLFDNLGAVARIATAAARRTLNCWIRAGDLRPPAQRSFGNQNRVRNKRSDQPFWPVAADPCERNERIHGTVPPG